MRGFRIPRAPASPTRTAYAKTLQQFMDFKILSFALYKIHFFCIFIQKNLVNSKIFCTFVPDLNEEANLIGVHKCEFNILTIRFYSQINN